MKFPGFVLLLLPFTLLGQARTDSNVIYGMYSGTALLLDVHVPVKEIGKGILFVGGSAWQSPVEYSASGLKEQAIPDWKKALLDAGFTIFAINHRGAPHFPYPAAIDDLQRAIRFVRHHGSRYRIDPNSIGAIGGSFGAHLITLAAMRQTPGDLSNTDPVNRQSAALQCVVAMGGPSNLTTAYGASTFATAAVVSFMAALPSSTTAQRNYREASPVAHVSSNAPPVLLIHGEADEVIPIEQSVLFERVLQEKNIPVKLIRVAGGTHSFTFGPKGKPNASLPEVVEQSMSWFKEHLLVK